MYIHYKFSKKCHSLNWHWMLLGLKMSQSNPWTSPIPDKITCLEEFKLDLDGGRSLRMCQIYWTLLLGLSLHYDQISSEVCILSTYEIWSTNYYISAMFISAIMPFLSTKIWSKWTRVWLTAWNSTISLVIEGIWYLEYRRELFI